MTHIKSIPYEESDGRLREIYDDIIAKRGKLAEVHKIQSLHPETIVHHMELYMSVMFSKSPLSRAERELLGVVSSIHNQCEYCQEHHIAALNHYWKDDQKIAQLKTGIKNGFTEREIALINYAETLTLAPKKSESGVPANALKGIGFSDREILDCSLVVGYFNFVNRIVMSLGVSLIDNPESGFKFDG